MRSHVPRGPGESMLIASESTPVLLPPAISPTSPHRLEPLPELPPPRAFQLEPAPYIPPPPRRRPLAPPPPPRRAGARRDLPSPLSRLQPRAQRRPAIRIRRRLR